MTIMLMALMGLPWCDFVVWTDAKCGNIFVEGVVFDADFVRDMMSKLVALYSEYVVPKLALLLFHCTCTGIIEKVYPLCKLKMCMKLV